MLWDDPQEVLLTADLMNLSADPTFETTHSDDIEPEAAERGRITQCMRLNY